jgi:hypothetical protein
MKVWRLREENIKTGEISYSERTHLYFLILLACRISNLSETEKIYHIEEDIL